MKKLLVVVAAFGLVIIGILIGQSNSNSPTTTQEAKKPDPALQAICSRETTYKLEPRFQRALSLIRERSDVNSERAKSIIVGFFYPTIKNCLDVSYCPANEMQGAEGLFYFSKDISSKDKYKICVSDTYQQEDDLLTSVVLVHEITHAIQFALENSGGRTTHPDCYDLEAEAFAEQIYYVFSLTQGEFDSLFTRTDLQGIQSPQISDLKSLLIQSVNLQKNYDPQTWTTLVRNAMRDNVVKNPYYQNQCSV